MLSVENAGNGWERIVNREFEYNVHIHRRCG
jgi:hypothetical protein